MNKKKMEAIILLGHGSRVPGASRDMEEIAGRLKEKYGYAIVEVCFMSRLGPHFPEALKACVRSGATRVVVIPYFLHLGLHIILDIPEMMQKEARKFPHVELILGQRFGFDEALVDLVHKNIEVSRGFDDVRQMVLPSKEQYPVPPGQAEFVPMLPDEAETYRKLNLEAFGEEDDGHH